MDLRLYVSKHPFSDSSVSHPSQLLQDQRNWGAILTEAVRQYTVGPNDATPRPLFLSEPSQSRIYPASYAAFTELPGSEVQRIFGQKHFLLSDAPGPVHGFDLEGMQCIADVFWKTEFQGELRSSVFLSMLQGSIHPDQSIPIRSNNLTSRNHRGCLYDMYTCATGPVSQQRPLNGLSFPQHHQGLAVHPNFATDARALQRTYSQRGCFKTFPIADIRFGLAATRRAHTYWHIDQRGEATYVRVIAGLKAWLIATPKNPAGGASIEFWSNPKLNVSNVDLSEFDIEIFLMGPGDML